MQPIDQDLQRDPTVQRVYALEYEIRFKFRNGREYLDFQVSQNAQPAGFATFQVRSHSQEVSVEQIVVHRQHRRKGIANALAVCAGKLTGFNLVSSQQTEDGTLWWNQPSRPW